MCYHRLPTDGSLRQDGCVRTARRAVIIDDGRRVCQIQPPAGSSDVAGSVTQHTHTIAIVRRSAFAHDSGRRPVVTGDSTTRD
jgi:hypothetical protein